jgi:hypothetical protein
MVEQWLNMVEQWLNMVEQWLVEYGLKVVVEMV